MTKEEFKENRKELGLSQEKIARELGVSVMTIQRWESGESKIPPYMELTLKGLKEDKNK